MQLASWAKKVVVFVVIGILVSSNLLLLFNPQSTEAATPFSLSSELNTTVVLQKLKPWTAGTIDMRKASLDQLKDLASLLQLAEQYYNDGTLAKEYPSQLLGLMGPDWSVLKNSYSLAQSVVQDKATGPESVFQNKFITLDKGKVTSEMELGKRLKNLDGSLQAVNIIPYVEGNPTVVDPKTVCQTFYEKSGGIIQSNVGLLKKHSYISYEGEGVDLAAEYQLACQGKDPFFKGSPTYTETLEKLAQEQRAVEDLYKKVVINTRVLEAVTKEKTPDGALYTIDGGGTFSGKPISKSDVLSAAAGGVSPAVLPTVINPVTLPIGLILQYATGTEDLKNAETGYINGIIDTWFSGGASETSGMGIYRQLLSDRTELKKHISNIHALSFVLLSKAAVAKKYPHSGYTFGSSNYDGLITGGSAGAGSVIHCVDTKACKTNPTPFKTVHELLAEFAPYDNGGASFEAVTKVGEQSEKYFNDEVGKNGADLSDPCYINQGGAKWNIFYPSKSVVFGALCSVVYLGHQIVTSILYTATRILQTQTGAIIPNSATQVGCTEQANMENEGTCKLTPTYPEPGADYHLFGFLDIGDFVKPIQDILVSNQSFGQAIQAAYTGVLRSVNVVLIVLLIFLAIINILQVQINTYGLSKVLPTLLLGFVLAQGSMFAIRASLEVTDKLAGGILSLGIKETDETSRNDFSGFINAFSSFPFSIPDIAQSEEPACQLTDSWLTTLCDPNASNNSFSLSKVIKLLLHDIFTVIGAILLLVLGFQLILRRFVFFFLVPLAPLAALAFGFPPGQSLWNRWWKTFIGWLFMPLAAVFWVWLALVWFHAADTNTTGGTLSSVVSYVFGIVALYLAIKTPSSMVGEVKIAGKMMDSFVKGTVEDRAKNGFQRAREVGQYNLNRFTPAGALKRNKAKSNALWQERLKEQTEGAVFKGKMARQLGGDAYNRRMESGWRNLDGMKHEQTVSDNRIKQLSEEDYMNRREYGLLGETRKKKRGRLDILQEAIDKDTESLKKEIEAQKNLVSNTSAARKKYQKAWERYWNAETEAYESSLESSKGAAAKVAEAKNRAAKEIGKLKEDTHDSSIQTLADKEIVNRKPELHQAKQEEIKAKLKAAQRKQQKDKATTELLADQSIKQTDSDEIKAGKRIHNEQARRLRESLATEQAINDGIGKDWDKEIKKQNEHTASAVMISKKVDTIMQRARDENRTLEDHERREIKLALHNLQAISGDNSFDQISDQQIDQLVSDASGMAGVQDSFKAATNKRYKIGSDRQFKVIVKNAAMFSNEEAKANVEQGMLTSALRNRDGQTDIANAMRGQLDQIAKEKDRNEARHNLAAIQQGLMDGSISYQDKENFISIVQNNEDILRSLTHDPTDDEQMRDVRTHLEELKGITDSRELQTKWKGFISEYHTEKLGMSNEARFNPVAQTLTAGTAPATDEENNLKKKGAYEQTRNTYDAHYNKNKNNQNPPNNQGGTPPPTGGNPPPGGNTGGGVGLVDQYGRPLNP